MPGPVRGAASARPADRAAAYRPCAAGYRPFHWGARFSRKACMPSFWSSVAKRL